MVTLITREADSAEKEPCGKSIMIQADNPSVKQLSNGLGLTGEETKYDPAETKMRLFSTHSPHVLERCHANMSF